MNKFHEQFIEESPGLKQTNKVLGIITRKKLNISLNRSFQKFFGRLEVEKLGGLFKVLFIVFIVTRDNISFLNSDGNTPVVRAFLKINSVVYK